MTNSEKLLDVPLPSKSEINEAIELGRECLAINEAISEFRIAFGNRTLSDDAKFDFAWSPLFRGLSDRRGEIRRRLYEIGVPADSGYED